MSTRALGLLLLWLGQLAVVQDGFAGGDDLGWESGPVAHAEVLGRGPSGHLPACEVDPGLGLPDSLWIGSVRASPEDGPVEHFQCGLLAG